MQGVNGVQKEREAKEMKEDHPVWTGGETGLEGAGGSGGITGVICFTQEPGGGRVMP